jgi:putative membrane protein
MKIALALCAAIALPAIALADDPKSNDKTTSADKSKDNKAKLSESDTALVAHAHMVNQMEIDLGKIAQKQGSAPVKKFGEMMVQDHSTADQELTAFAKKHGVAKIPADKPATEAGKEEHKEAMATAAKVKGLKGAEFDREYINMMVQGHDKELGRADTDISMVSDPDLKQMLEARKTMLKRHADAARDVQRGNPQASAKP